MNRKKEGIIGFGIITAALTTAFIIFGARANDTDPMDGGNEAKKPEDNGNGANGVITLHKALELGHKKISTIDLSNLKHLSGVDVYTLNLAIASRDMHAGLIFHTDRGSQFTSKTFRQYLDTLNIMQSFSAKGYPYDNAVMSLLSDNRLIPLFIHKYRSKS